MELGIEKSMCGVLQQNEMIQKGTNCQRQHAHQETLLSRCISHCSRKERFARTKPKRAPSLLVDRRRGTTCRAMQLGSADIFHFMEVVLVVTTKMNQGGSCFFCGGARGNPFAIFTVLLYWGLEESPGSVRHDFPKASERHPLCYSEELLQLLPMHVCLCALHPRLNLPIPSCSHHLFCGLLMLNRPAIRERGRHPPEEKDASYPAYDPTRSFQCSRRGMQRADSALAGCCSEISRIPVASGLESTLRETRACTNVNKSV